MQKNHGNEGPEGVRLHRHNEVPYWKQAHQSWWFWVGVILMLVAITIFVLSDNLALLPARGPGR